MHGHMHRPGKVNRQIRENPLVAVLRDLDDPIARLHAQVGQSRRPARHIVGNLPPTSRDPLTRSRGMEGQSVARFGHSAPKEFDQRSTAVMQLCDIQQLTRHLIVTLEN